MKKRIVFLIVTLLLIFSSIWAFSKIDGNDSPIKVFGSKKEFKSYKAGDRVNFASRNWIVMYDSSKKEEVITLISSEVIYLDDIPYVFDGIYETSKLNDYLKNNFAKEIGESNLVSKNGYKVRLLNEDDMRKLLEVDYNSEDDSYEIENCPDYICLYNSYYATMIDTKSIEKEDVYNNFSDIENIDTDDFQLHLNYYNISNLDGEEKLESIVGDATLFIRPVINLKKDSIE